MMGKGLDGLGGPNRACEGQQAVSLTSLCLYTGGLEEPSMIHPTYGEILLSINPLALFPPDLEQASRTCPLTLTVYLLLSRSICMLGRD